MAQYEDLEFDQGTDVSIDIYLVNKDNSIKDLSGYSAAAKMALNYDATDSDKISFDANIASPSTAGVVNLALTNAVTDTLNTKKRYVYDVEVSYVDSDAATIIEPVLRGLITVNPTVT